MCQVVIILVLLLGVEAGRGGAKCRICGRRSHDTADCHNLHSQRFSSSQKSEPVRLPRGAQTAGSSSVTSPLLQQSHLPQFPAENNVAVCDATSGPSVLPSIVNPQQLEYSHQRPPPLLPFPGTGTTQHALPLPTCPAAIIEEVDPCTLPCCEDDFESLIQAMEASVRVFSFNKDEIDIILPTYHDQHP